MKKIFGFVVVLGLLFLVFQFGINILKSSHFVSYQIEVSEKNIVIDEEYIKTKNDNYYFFKLIVDDNSFVFDVDNKFNKQKKVISDIKLYEEDDLICISPVYIKDIDDVEIICTIDGLQTSYTEVIEHYDIEEFVNSIDNFNTDRYDSFDTTVSIDKLRIYKDNIYDDENLVVYDYKELIKINNKIRRRIEFSNYDVYKNEMGRLIGKNYIIPTFENKPEYSSFLVIDIISEEQEKIKFDNAISTNLYVNGVVDDKLYFFDKSNLIQYEIDPEKNNYRIVGNKSTNGQYYDGEWSTKNIYNFYTQELIFNQLYPIKDNYIKAFETSKYYYYYNNNNEFYKVYKNELDNPIYLFEYDELKEVQVTDDCIYFINQNTIYRYDDNGIKKLVTNNEFKYNYENIYGVYYK